MFVFFFFYVLFQFLVDDECNVSSFSILPNALLLRTRRTTGSQVWWSHPAVGDLDDDSTSSSLNEAIGRVKNSFQNLTAPEIQRQLVEKGMEFGRQEQHGQDVASFTPTPFEFDNDSTFERVPGCTATVYIAVDVTDDDKTIRDLRGWSDAHVSRGLVATMAECLRSVSVDDVIVNGTALLSNPASLGLQTALSPGRRNGWESLYDTIRKQLLARKQQQQQGKGEDLVLQTESAPESKLSTQESDSSFGLADSEDTQLVANQSNFTSTTQATPKATISVALLLSGGVDSSVALHLLLQNSTYNVTAFYLKIWLEDELSHMNECPWEDDIQHCQAVCTHANVPLRIVSLQEQYKERVLQHTLAEAQAGRTPNPDILCNSRIKMGVFWDTFCQEQGFDLMATGHYAMVHNGRLWRAPQDQVKDQSYFLCALTSTQLQRVMFPIGHLSKAQVRELAHDTFALPNKNRPDSQGLCFLGKLKFDTFLSHYLPDRPGPVVDATAIAANSIQNNTVVGRHRGLHYHTIGQRKQLGHVLDAHATSRGPWYVVAKDVQTQTLYCSNQYDAFTETRSRVIVEGLHWIQQQHKSTGRGDHQETSVAYDFKIRHGPRLARGRLLLASQDATTAEILLMEKDSGLAPGQTVAIYNITTAECLGCGIISEQQWTRFLEQRKQEAAGVVAETRGS